MKFGISVFSIMLSLVCLQAQQASPKKPAPTKKPSAVSASEEEAKKHYKIAVVALQNNDLGTAEDELKKAADLSPKNALIFYNLAVVASKQNDLHAADSNLTKAEQLGIPATQKEDAGNLRADIEYKLKVQTKKEEEERANYQQASELERWLGGSWHYRGGYDMRPDTECISHFDGQDETFSVTRVKGSNTFLGYALKSRYRRIKQNGGDCGAPYSKDELHWTAQWNITSVTPGRAGGVDGAVARMTVTKCEGLGCPYSEGAVTEVWCELQDNALKCLPDFFGLNKE